MPLLTRSRFSCSSKRHSDAAPKKANPILDLQACDRILEHLEQANQNIADAGSLLRQRSFGLTTSLAQSIPSTSIELMVRQVEETWPMVAMKNEERILALYRIVRYFACFLAAHLFASIDSRCTLAERERATMSIPSLGEAAIYIDNLSRLQSRAKFTYLKAVREAINVIQGASFFLLLESGPAALC